MGGQAHPETARKVSKTTEGNLIGAIKQGRAEVAVRNVVVGGLQNKVLIVIRTRTCDLRSAGVLEAGKAVAWKFRAFTPGIGLATFSTSFICKAL